MSQSPLLKINDEVTINLYQIETMRMDRTREGGAPGELPILSLGFPSGENVQVFGDEAQRTYDFIVQHCETVPPPPPPAATEPAADNRFQELVDQNEQ